MGDDPTTSDDKKLIESLKKLNLHGTDFCYTAIHVDKLDSVHNSGTVSKSNPSNIFVFSVCRNDSGEEYIGEKEGNSSILNFLASYSDHKGFANLVVYRASALIGNIGNIVPATFKDVTKARDAVVAIVKVGGFIGKDKI